MELKSSVEALLYASKDPVSITDMAIILKEDKEAVAKALRSLTSEYNRRKSSLMISRSGIRYKMELRDEYHDIAFPVSEPEYSQKELSILGFIASNPGIRRGLLRDFFGEKYMEPVMKLKKDGLIKSDKYRNTELYNVTKKFYKHFNVSQEQIEDMAEGEKEE